MCIYFVIDLTIFILILISYGKSKKIKEVLLAISCVLWCMVFGLRGYDVGNDTPGYAAFFDGSNSPGVGYGTVDFPGDTIEPVFVYFSRVLSFLSDSPTFFFLVVSSLLFFCVFLLYNRLSDNGIWSLLIFFIIGNTFYPLMTMMRQVTSICLLLLSVLLFLKAKNYTRESNKHDYLPGSFLYIMAFVLLIASLFAHRTSVLLFPLLIILYKIKINRVFSYVIVSTALIIALFMPQVIGVLFDFVLSQIGMMEDDDVALLGNRYAESFGQTGASPIRMAAWAIPALFTIYNTETNKIGSFAFNCFIISITLFLTMNSSFMVTRLNLVFLLIGFCVFIPQKVNNDKRIYILYIFITLYYLWRAYVGFENWPYEQDTSLPYKFFWE